MKKKIKDLTDKEAEKICANIDYCWDCELLGTGKCRYYNSNWEETEIEVEE